MMREPGQKYNTRAGVSISAMIVVLAAGASASADLIASYSFSGNANDSSGNGHDGFVSGAQLTADRFGNPNSAYQFDNVDDFIEVPNTAGAFDINGAFTLAAWVRPFNDGIDGRTDPIIWKIGDPGTNQDNYLLDWGQGNAFSVGLERNDDVDFGLQSNPHTPDNWYHVAGVYDGNSFLMYVNGVLESTRTIGAQTPYSGTAPLRIGSTLHSSHVPRGVFDGIIDEVAIFDNALSASEIRNLAGIPAPGVVSVFVFGGLVGFQSRRRSG